MKKYLLNFSMSFFCSLIVGIIVCLVLAILKSNNSLDDNASNICLTVLTILLFFIFGFIFSFAQKKRGIINGLFLSAIYLIIYFILNALNIYQSPLYITISRIASIMLGSLFGVNLASKGDRTN